MDRNFKKERCEGRRFEKLSECFLHFGPDPRLNINMLTQLCGEILGAACALYNRLQDGCLIAWGQWQAPVDFNPVDRAEGHICYDVISSSGNDILLVRDLPNTSYADSDPNVRKFNLQTYIGVAASLNGEKVGSLCAVFQSDYVPSQADITLLRLIGKAIGIEEKELHAKGQSRDAYGRLFSILDNLDTVVFVSCLQSHEVLYMNGCARALFGKGLGKKCWQVFQKDQRGPCRFCPNPSFLAEPDRQGLPRSWEMKNTRNGRWYDMRDSAITWVDGRLARLQIATDISDSKAYEEKLRQITAEWERTFDAIADPIMVLDENYRIVKANKAFRDKVGLLPAACRRKRCYELVHGTTAPIAECPFSMLKKDGEARVAEVRAEKLGGTFRFSVSPVFDGEGKVIRGICVGHESAERIQCGKSRQTLVNRLNDALDQARTLPGIVPICSFCKQIRNEEGDWQELEKFVSHNTGVSFSHSICPACLRKNYPDILAGE